MNTTYQFENCDGDKFPETYNSLKEALKECSDYKSFKCRADGGYYTREGGFVYEVEN